MAAECGVKSVTLGYAEQGCRAQDLAAVRALYRLGSEYLARAGHPDVAVNVVWHQYMGPFPRSEDKARQIVAGSTASATQSGAVRMMLKTHVEALRIPRLEDNVESLRIAREVRDRGIVLASLNERDRLEEELILTEAKAIVDISLKEAHQNVGRAVGLAVNRGWLDIPFSPSRWNAGLVLPLRDHTNAVRFAVPGQLPLSPDVLAFHRDALAQLLRRDGDDVAALLERDISVTARGDFDEWPLQ